MKKKIALCFPAFSIIELLIALIVISCITAAFAPVITAKITHKNITFNNIKVDCSKFDPSGRCLMCDKTKCTLCSTSLTIFGTDKYVNPAVSCDAKPCSDFDANCKKCSSNKCTDCKIGYKLADGNCIEIKCNPGQYKSGSSCVNCPEGTYRKEDNHTFDSCNDCDFMKMNCSECSPKTGFCSSCKSGEFWDGEKCASCDSNCKTCVDEATKCTSCADTRYDLKKDKCVKNPCRGIGVEIYFNNKKYCFLDKNFYDGNAPEELKEVFSNLTANKEITIYRLNYADSFRNNVSSSICQFLARDTNGNYYNGYSCTTEANIKLCSALADSTKDKWRLFTYDELVKFNNFLNNNDYMRQKLNLYAGLTNSLKAYEYKYEYFNPGEDESWRATLAVPVIAAGVKRASENVCTQYQCVSHNGSHCIVKKCISSHTVYYPEYPVLCNVAKERWVGNGINSNTGVYEKSSGYYVITASSNRSYSSNEHPAGIAINSNIEPRCIVEMDVDASVETKK